MVSEITTSLLARGILHSLDLQRPRPGTPLFFQASAQVSAPPYCSSPYATVPAGGTHSSPEIALIKAIGEGVERYCATRCNLENLLHASFAELGDPGVPPASFDLFSDSQRGAAGFPFQPVPSSTQPLTWTAGFTLEGKPVWLPASLVHLYQRFAEAEHFESCPVSGYACGRNFEDAVLRGLCEVAERDALMSSWYAWRTTRRLDLAACPDPAVHDVLARFHQLPCKVVCQDLTTEIGIPVVLAAMFTDRGPLSVVVATAAAPSLAAAATKAIEELASNFSYLDGTLKSGARLPQKLSEVTQMHDHGLFYLPRSRHRLLSHLISETEAGAWGEAPKHSATVAAQTSALGARLQRAGLNAFVADLTQPEVKDLGFRVVKVLIPGAYPIDYGRDLPHWGGRRLPLLGSQWQAEISRPIPSAWNRWPHPFP